MLHNVIDEVATREETDPTEIQPLYDAVDPDALSTLIESSRSESLRIEFAYCGYTITVTGNSSVKIGTQSP